MDLHNLNVELEALAVVVLVAVVVAELFILTLRTVPVWYLLPQA
jgi:hypothetical protein